MKDFRANTNQHPMRLSCVFQMRFFSGHVSSNLLSLFCFYLVVLWMVFCGMVGCLFSFKIIFTARVYLHFNEKQIISVESQLLEQTFASPRVQPLG